MLLSFSEGLAEDADTTGGSMSRSAEDWEDYNNVPLNDPDSPTEEELDDLEAGKFNNEK